MFPEKFISSKRFSAVKCLFEPLRRISAIIILWLVGLINQVESFKDTSIFDTNTDSHHHFLDEETGELTDINDNEINLLKLPDVPYGYIKKGVDVIIKIKKNI